MINSSFNFFISCNLFYTEGNEICYRALVLYTGNNEYYIVIEKDSHTEQRITDASGCKSLRK